MSKTDIAIGLAIAVVIVNFLIIWPKNSASEGALLQGASTPKELVQEGNDLYVFAGPKWAWIETKYNDGKVVKPNKSDVFSITFDSARGRVSGATDCNGFGANYTSSAWGGLTFGPFLSTQMFCEGSQEQEFRKMIEDSDRYIFTESGDLVLLLKMDSGSVVFKVTR